MENIILIVLKALGALGEKGVHYVLDRLEAFIVLSTTLIDNEVFYRVIEHIKSWTPKNPPIE